MSGFDLKQVTRNDKGVVGAGIVTFIASLLPFYGNSFVSVNAWHSWGVLGMLLILVALAISAGRVFADVKLPVLPIGPNLLVAALAGLGTALLILRGITYPDFGGAVGLQWGAYVVFIAGAAMTAFAVLNFRESGEKLEWDASALNRPAPASPQAGAVPPVAPPAQPAAPTTEQSTTYPPSDQGSPTV